MDKQMKKQIVGLTISNKRQERDITQQKLAELTGLSRNYISDIENGRYMPSVEALTKIAQQLNIDLNFLISMTEIQC